MKKIILMTTVFATVFAVSNAFAESTAEGTGTAKAKIVAPVEVTKTQNLNFGTIAKSTSANTVTLTNAGARSAAVANTLINDSTETKGIMTITGPESTSVTIQEIADTTVTGPTGSTPMAVTDFNTNPSGTVVLGSTGAQAVDVGAKLAVGANQTEGEYSGSYTVQVTY